MKVIDKPRSWLRYRRPLLAPALMAALLAGCASQVVAPLSTESIAAIVASPDRSAADRNNDIRRKPADMLAFIGVTPGMVTLDLSAGGGYTTELLARAVGPTGRVYGQNVPRDVANPPRQPLAREGNTAPAPTAAATPPVRRTLADRAASPATSNIIPVQRKFEDPIPPELKPGTLDLATLMFNYHDLGYQGVDRAQMNRAVFAALKPGGFYVIADHSGRPGTGISESGTLHRIEEAFLRKEIESAGFRLAGEGIFLRNPSDPRDKNTPEPPQPKDEFVLKFVKP
jgi:predicted methyltransferase